MRNMYRFLRTTATAVTAILLILNSFYLTYKGASTTFAAVGELKNNTSKVNSEMSELNEQNSSEGSLVEVATLPDFSTPKAVMQESVSSEDVGVLFVENTIEDSLWNIMEHGAAISKEAVSVHNTYKAPQNEKVTVKFNKLPENPGTLTIKEVTLSAKEQADLGALSDKAYDITSTMENGTFSYDLTLPKSGDDKNIEVKYAETRAELDEAVTVTQKTEVASDTITVKGLNHFTVFVLVNDDNSGAITGINDDNIATGATVTGIQDTFTNELQPTIKKDTVTELRVKSNPGNNRKRAYIRFQQVISSLINSGIHVSDAKLRLFVTTAPTNNRTYEIAPLATSLNEAATDWTSHPAADASVGSAVVLTSAAGTWVEWNVTSDVQAIVNGSQGNNGWEIKDKNEDIDGRETIFASSNKVNAAQRPQLIINADVTAPTTVDSGTDTVWHNTNVTVMLTCSDKVSGSGCASTYYTTNGASPTLTSSAGLSGIVSTDGVNIVKYFSVDNSGNQEAVKTAVNTVMIDKTAPVITINTTPTNPTNDNSPIYTGTAADSLSGVTGVDYKIFNVTATTLFQDWTAVDAFDGTNFTFTSPEVSPGAQYRYSIRATDAATNIETQDNLVVIDIIAPTVLAASPVGGDYTSDQNVTLTSTDANTVIIYYTLDGSTPTTTSASVVNGGSVLVDHSLTLKAIAVDAANNQSGVMTEVYGIAPVISAEAMQLTAVSGTEARITWTTDDPATSRVVYGTSSVTVLGAAPDYGYANSTVMTDVSPKVLSHSVLLTGLTPNTTYYYRVISSGSPETVSSEHSFTMGAADNGNEGTGGGGTDSDTSDNSTSSTFSKATTGKIAGDKTVTPSNSTSAFVTPAPIVLAAGAGGPYPSSTTTSSGSTEGTADTAEEQNSEDTTTETSPTPTPGAGWEDALNTDSTDPDRSRMVWYLVAVIVILGVAYYIYTRRQ